MTVEVGCAPGVASLAVFVSPRWEGKAGEGVFFFVVEAFSDECFVMCVLGSTGGGGLKFSASVRIDLRSSCILDAGNGSLPSTILYKIHPILQISLKRRSKSVCGV